jgi:hypothetical protein
VQTLGFQVPRTVSTPRGASFSGERGEIEGERERDSEGERKREKGGERKERGR